MARKDGLVGFLMFGASGADMSQALVTSSITGINWMDNAGILLSWTGTSPVGAFTIEVSNDYNLSTQNAGIWVALDFGSTIAISGNTGTHILSMNQLPYTYMRAKYTKTSGTGTLTAVLSTKQVGG